MGIVVSFNDKETIIKACLNKLDNDFLRLNRNLTKRQLKLDTSHSVAMFNCVEAQEFDCRNNFVLDVSFINIYYKMLFLFLIKENYFNIGNNVDKTITQFYWQLSSLVFFKEKQANTLYNFRNNLKQSCGHKPLAVWINGEFLSFNDLY